MNQSSTTWGGLNCQVIDKLAEGQEPQLLVILCHGFGASGTDLVSLGPELFGLNPDLEAGVRFVFPAAPLKLEEFAMFGGRAWWRLNVAHMTEAIQRGELQTLRDELPDGLPEARQMLSRLAEEVMEQTGLPTSRLVLGGFSQGSMVATDVALHLPEPPAALCIFSGTLRCETVWRELAARLGPFPVLQSHGRADPLLPFQAAQWLRDLFVEAGMDVDFIPFDGMHTIPYEAVDRFAALLGRIV